MHSASNSLNLDTIRQEHGGSVRDLSCSIAAKTNDLAHGITLSCCYCYRERSQVLMNKTLDDNTTRVTVTARRRRAIRRGTFTANTARIIIIVYCGKHLI